MCGRYSLATPNPAQLRERFGLGFDAALEPRFNIAPGQDVVAVTTDREGLARGDRLRWGLVPRWSKSPASGYKMINARAETLTERPAFRDALARRRCLLPADGFYEWQPRAHGPKQPWWITRGDGAPFAFAGLWATWRADPDGAPLRTCTIITTTACDALADVHARMPVILPAAAEQDWLAADTPIAALRELLAPLPSHEIARIPVSAAVNDVANDSSVCVLAVALTPDEPTNPVLF